MKPFVLNRITEHVTCSLPDGTTDRPVLGVIVGTRATLLIDVGNSIAHANLLLKELTRLNIAAPTYIVLTHWHWDHVFGGAAFAAPIFAYDETRRVVEMMAAQEWSDAALDQRVSEGSEIEFCRDMIKAELPDRSDLVIRPPDVSFATQMEFNLGGVHCLVKHVGGDHASDATVIYVPEDRLLFLGDCLYQDLYHGPWNYTTAKLFPLLDEIASYDAEWYIWSHSDTPMGKAEMNELMVQLRLIGTLVTRICDDRDRILQELATQLGKSPDEDCLEWVDAFLAGLRRGDRV